MRASGSPGSTGPEARSSPSRRVARRNRGSRRRSSVELVADLGGGRSAEAQRRAAHELRSQAAEEAGRAPSVQAGGGTLLLSLRTSPARGVQTAARRARVRLLKTSVGPAGMRQQYGGRRHGNCVPVGTCRAAHPQAGPLNTRRTRAHGRRARDEALMWYFDARMKPCETNKSEFTFEKSQSDLTRPAREETARGAHWARLDDLRRWFDVGD